MHPTLIDILLIELGVTTLLVLALLITCGALWNVRPPKGPPR